MPIRNQKSKCEIAERGVPARRRPRRIGRWLGVAILASALAASCTATAQSNHSGDTRPTHLWLQDHLLNAGPELPFSFVYGRQASAALLKLWPRKVESRRLDDNRTEYTITWTDPKTGLQVRLEAVGYAESGVAEWTVYFKNGGTLDTPILEDVQALDTSLSLTGSAIPTILYSKGCGGMDSYSLQKKPLNQLESFRMANESGGKTIDTIPFFDILTQGHGLIGAVGWPGDWAIRFSRPTLSAIAIRAGMENTHLILHPGEEIRTPQILLLPWSGDDMDAHNVLRRHILKYHTPHYDGKPVVLPVSHLGWGGMTTATSLQLIDQVAKEHIGFENFWMDAGWYGPNRKVDQFQVFGREDWFLYAGDWRVNKVPHPDGLKPISDAAHAHGMKFLLWFEPERAVEGTPLTIQHPDWFIGEVGTNFAGNDARPFVKFRMFNFGNPAARQFMTDWMSDLITKEGIDIYRQDCNFALSPFWSQADTRNRQGITQIRYVEGLLKFWDGLRQKHPHLILDIVQRGDLETISRAVDLSRSDYPVSPDADPVANQLGTEGLAYWRPHFGTLLQIRPRDTYHFRSGFAPGLGFALFNVAGTKDEVGKFIPADFPFDWLRTMVSQLKRVRPYYYGDYYPLLPCSSDSDCTASDERSAAYEWAAWQFNRPDRGDGMVQAFRRSENDESKHDLRLRGLDPAATYRVTNLDAPGALEISGQSLMQQGLPVEISSQPGAAILIYTKIP